METALDVSLGPTPALPCRVPVRPPLLSLRCPKEMDPHVPNVTSLCLQHMKHDPNYDHDSDEEEQMETEDSEFSEQGRRTACLRESRAQRPKQGLQQTRLAGCRSSLAVRRSLPACPVKQPRPKIPGEKVSLYSTHRQWCDSWCPGVYAVSSVFSGHSRQAVG